MIWNKEKHSLVDLNCTPVIKIHDIGLVRGILFDKTAQGARDFFSNKRLVLDFDRNDLSARFEHKIDLSLILCAPKIQLCRRESNLLFEQQKNKIFKNESALLPAPEVAKNA